MYYLETLLTYITILTCNRRLNYFSANKYAAFLFLFSTPLDQVEESVTLVAGDSMTKSLDIRELEAAAGSRVVLVKTYCSVKNWKGARFPSKNHEDVLHRVLKVRYSSVISSARSSYNYDPDQAGKAEPLFNLHSAH